MPSMARGAARLALALQLAVLLQLPPLPQSVTWRSAGSATGDMQRAIREHAAMLQSGEPHITCDIHDHPLPG